MIRYFVLAHLNRHGGLENTESAAEPAALVPARRLNEFDASYSLEQGTRFGIAGRSNFARVRKIDPAEGVTVIVQTHLVRKARPGEFAHLQDVVEELCELECSLAHRPDLRRLLNRGHVDAHLMHAASRRSDHIVIP